MADAGEDNFFNKPLFFAVDDNGWRRKIFFVQEGCQSRQARVVRLGRQDGFLWKARGRAYMRGMIPSLGF